MEGSARTASLHRYLYRRVVSTALPSALLLIKPALRRAVWPAAFAVIFGELTSANRSLLLLGCNCRFSS